MVNNCKFLYLGRCIRLKEKGDWFIVSCIYMADPQACPQYEEEFEKPYHTPSTREEGKEEEKK